MRRRTVAVFAVVLAVLGLASVSHGASIIWGNLAGGEALDSFGDPLEGIRASGEVNLMNGALVQLYKAVGDIDDPRAMMEFYEDGSQSFSVDDILLDQVHIGYGLGPPGQPALGRFSRSAEVDIIPGDTIYVRAYNLNPSDWAAADLVSREIGIRNDLDEIVTGSVIQVMNPETYLFQNLRTEPIPEPATLLLLAPGLALWAIRRKK